MKRRYIAAIVTFLFAAAGLFPQTTMDGLVVGLVICANAMLVSVHFIDRLVDALVGISIGSFEVESDGRSDE